MKAVRQLTTFLGRVREAVRWTFEGGKLDRTTDRWRATPQSGNAADLGEVQRLRWRAWDLYRNNPYAYRAVQSIISHVLGCGLDPSPKSLTVDREPDGEFQEGCRALWDAWTPQAHAIGLPGYGGQTFEQLAQQALVEVAVSGEVLIRFRHLPPSLARKERRLLPFAVELISCERLAEEYDYGASSSTAIPDGHYLYRGIEFDRNDRRAAYHIWDHHPNDPLPNAWQTKTTRIPADSVLHLYWADRPDQLRGNSWLSRVLLHLRDVADYQENELQSSMAAACVALVITKQPNSGGTGMLNRPAGGAGTDRDGNRLTRMQPAMFAELNPGESIQGFNPARPNGSAAEFINHLLRSVAIGMPGVKPSTMTGDYSKATFTSEKACDNDVWRVVEQLQEWMAASFHQPIYERLIDAGVEAGWFDGQVSAPVYLRQRQRYVAATWNGPVPKSVNPAVDIKAAELAMAIGISNHEIEAASQGLSTDEIIAGEVRYMEKRKQAGLDQLELDKAKEQAEVEAIAKPQPAGGNVPGKGSNGGPEGNIGQNQKRPGRRSDVPVAGA